MIDFDSVEDLDQLRALVADLKQRNRLLTLARAREVCAAFGVTIPSHEALEEKIEPAMLALDEQVDLAAAQAELNIRRFSGLREDA